MQLGQRANAVLPLGCRSNFQRCSTAKPGSQVSSHQGQEQPPGGGGKVPRTPSPGGSDGNDDQQPRDNCSGQASSKSGRTLTSSHQTVLRLCFVGGAATCCIMIRHGSEMAGILQLVEFHKTYRERVHCVCLFVCAQLLHAMDCLCLCCRSSISVTARHAATAVQTGEAGGCRMCSAA